MPYKRNVGRLQRRFTVYRSDYPRYLTIINEPVSQYVPKRLITDIRGVRFVPVIHNCMREALHVNIVSDMLLILAGIPVVNYIQTNRKQV